MAIEVKAIKCPQCGSTDVKQLDGTQWKCNSCRSKFIVEDQSEQDDSQENQECMFTKAKIAPQYSKEEFLGDVWIALSKGNTPIEVFDKDFSKVSVKERQIYIESIQANVSFQASIGYESKEPYIGYEDYYENEPYTVQEVHRSAFTGKDEIRNVTKYRKVKRQRQVTKYKTVTNWEAYNGTKRVSSVGVEDNKSNKDFNVEEFLESLQSFEKKNPADSLIVLTEEENEKLQPSQYAEDEVFIDHKNTIRKAIEASLPGDCYKDLSFTIDDSDTLIKALYIVPEYKASIQYEEKKYVWRAFPFGRMEVIGDWIIDTHDPIEEKKKNEEVAAQKVWEETKLAYYITLGLVSLAIFAPLRFVVSGFKGHVKTDSMVVKAIIVMSVFFVIAYFARKFFERFVERTAKEKTDIAERNTDAFSFRYEEERQGALKQKLKSLGFEGYQPPDDDEDEEEEDEEYDEDDEDDEDDEEEDEEYDEDDDSEEVEEYDE